MVSRRVKAFTAEPPALVTAHFRVEQRPYHPDKDPGGYVNFGTAENRLVWDLLAPILTGPRPVTAEDTRYAPLYGAAATREAIAGYLNRYGGPSVDPDDIIVVSGASAALDIISYILCDPGDAIVVPAPYYGGFDPDLTGRTEARIVPAPLAYPFWVTGDAVEAAVTQARRDGLTVRAIVLSSPHNPVGHVYPPDTLREVVEVAERHDLHLVADEIYAGSVFGSRPFTSFRTVTDSPRLHLVWGMAKDFGVSGFKVGVLHTRDPQVRAAARILAGFAPVSTDTQVIARRMLANADAFLTESQRRLGVAYAHITELLTAHGIPFVPAEGAFAVWVDLRGWLSAPTFEAEMELWEQVYRAKVSISPGRTFHSPEPGWFRICFPSDPVVVTEGITRLGRVLAERSSTTR